MAKLLLFYCLSAFIISVWGQENAIRNLSPSLKECYDNKFLLQRNNRLPHTLNTFISILRKIENVEGLNMDLRTLSVALLHRFRQDGIVPNPSVPIQDGVTPYVPFGFQFFRHSQTLQFIQGNALQFPNNSITNIERCTLHFMLSDSIEMFERGDEAIVCKYVNPRHSRSLSNYDEVTNKGTSDMETDDVNTDDVETLTSDEIKTMSNPKDETAKVTVDPNSLYPELPPNHPDASKLLLPPQSRCPIQNGVIKTPWGVVSPGLVLSAIAAATQPEKFMLHNLQPELAKKYSVNLSDVAVDNKWFATLAGDLAEVVLIQGPIRSKVSVGTTGHWNSTALPRWFFLDSNETFEMTTPEIRGDLDGSILANEIKKWYSKIPSLRLSQVFDMYYSERGFFDPSIRAANRRSLFPAVAPNETMIEQVYSASLVLNTYIAAATLDLEKIKQFSVQAVNDLITYVPSMNMDLQFEKSDSNNFHETNVDLTIILDTNWAFSAIQPILATLLESIELNPFNSNFTLMNGYDGSEIINSTFSIQDFYAYNSSRYDNLTHTFDLSKSITKVQNRLMNKLENERKRGEGGARSDIVLIIPYTSVINAGDKQYCLQNILQMQEHIPDTTFLVMAYGSKDTWSDFVKNPATDLFTIGIGDTEEALSPINNLVSRIKQVPKRLINTQCGSDYVPSGSSNAYVDYVTPNSTNLYRLHPNYFFKTEGSSTIKIQGTGLDKLTICSAREPLYVNNTQNVICGSIINEAYNVTISCASATFIHACPPLYLSVTANSTDLSTSCTDRQKCRFSTSIKYTISYEDLTCVSGASRIAFSSFILIVLLTFLDL
ncbi:uncharacterized protein LOC117225429 [Megalopta genalis]|uniref:uncharacterized protein LOC117225429 n=1 Tax=Megalopta genalis TaxID=115081 RepID=UPI003FCFF29F